MRLVRPKPLDRCVRAGGRGAVVTAHVLEGVQAGHTHCSFWPGSQEGRLPPCSWRSHSGDLGGGGGVGGWVLQEYACVLHPGRTACPARDSGVTPVTLPAPGPPVTSDLTLVLVLHAGGS